MKRNICPSSRRAPRQSPCVTSPYNAQNSLSGQKKRSVTPGEISHPSHASASGQARPPGALAGQLPVPVDGNAASRALASLAVLGQMSWSAVQLGALIANLRVAVQKFAHLGLAEPAVPAWGPDAADPTGCSPPRNSLRVDSEERGYFPRREQPLTVAVHRIFSLVPEGLPQVSQKLANLATNCSFIP